MLIRFPAMVRLPFAPRWPDQFALLLALLASWLMWRRAHAEPTTRPVLVYLANETRMSAAGARNAQVIDEWLRAAGDADATVAAEGLANDRERFPAVVDGDVALLGRELLVDTVIATNRSVREGRLWFGAAGHALAAEPFDAPALTGDAVVDDNPMSTAPVLARVFDSIAERFPAEQHHFIVLLKSHGIGELVLTPRLTVRHEQSSPADVVARARGEAGDRASDGVSRGELFALLHDAGLPIRLLVLEVCGGGSSLAGSDLPQNIRAAAAGVNALEYSNLSFDGLGADPLRSLRRQIDAHARLRWVDAPRPVLAALLLPIAVLALVTAREMRRGWRGRAER